MRLTRLYLRNYRVYQDDGLEAEWIIGVDPRPGRWNYRVHPPDDEGNQKIEREWMP